MTDFYRPVSALRAAVVDGLMIKTQVVQMDLQTAERVADRIMEALEHHAHDLTVIDRSKVAAWLGALDVQVRPLLALRGRGTGVCDVRGHHDMELRKLLDWPYDVSVCVDCEHAMQIERE